MASAARTPQAKLRTVSRKRTAAEKPRSPATMPEATRRSRPRKIAIDVSVRSSRWTGALPRAAALCRRRGFRRWQLVSAEEIKYSAASRRLLSFIKKLAGELEEVDWDVFKELLAQAGRAGYLILPLDEPKRRRARR